MTTTNTYHSKVGFIYALTQNQFDHIHFIDDIIRTFFDIIENTETVQIFIFTVCNKILDFLLKK